VTLLEVLVAAIVLSIGLLGAMDVVARSAVTARAVDDRTRALLSARSKLEEILKEPVLQVGTDRGEGVDTSTDYDWEAVIEQSDDPNLYFVVITVRNRTTQLTETLSALRRPDIETAPETTGTSDTSGTTGTGTAAGAGAGGAL
jgi:type II secretion system protein I